jgi:predicted GIY-YIG superfamily endonuclease
MEIPQSPQIDQFVTVYLLHLDNPLIKSGNSHPQHYLGSTISLEGRLYHHRKGTGSKFLREANERNIQYSIAADWGARRQLEMCMKQTKNLRQFCPVCMGKAVRDPLTFPFKSILPANHPVRLINAPKSNISLVPYNHIDKGDNVLRIEKNESGAPYTEEWRRGQRRILVPTPIEGVKMDVTDLIGKLD